MELLNPTRISSLEGKTIRVILHKDARRSEELSLPNVYPFETIFNLKQRIALSKADDKKFLPKYLFVAQDAGGGNYSTCEFFWPFSKTLKDPLSETGAPDPRIYEDGARKGDVFPNILSGVTVEAGTELFSGGAGDASRVIHVWTLASVAEAVGIRKGTLVPDETFEGFLQLYFPLLKSKADIQETFQSQDDEDRAAIAIARTYRTEMDARLAKVEAGLQASTTAAPLRLRELRNLRYVLPKKEELETTALELKFYAMNPNPAIPFIRYFPAKDASLPLIKLAVGPTGNPLITNPKILDLLMADTPNTDKSAVILLKAPVEHSQAPPGTAWSMSLFEDGTASLRIGAPRKDAPLTQAAIAAAFATLPTFLEHTAWTDADPRTLVELSAVYDFKSKLMEKPTRAELRGRLDAFLSFFLEEPLPEKSKATLMLRYRAVSNFETSKDPLENHLTKLYLYDTKATGGAVAEEEYVESLMRYFGVSQPDAVRAVAHWISNRFEYIRTERDKVVEESNIGTAVAIGTNNHPYYTFYLANVESMTGLQRILSLLTVFASLPASALAVAKAPAEKVAAKKAVEAVEEETPSPESVESADSVGGPPLGMQQFDFGDEDDAYEVAPRAPAPAPAAAAAVGTDSPAPPPPHLEVTEVELPDALKAGEKIGPVSFLSDLKKADEGLFDIKGKGDIYSKKCQANAFKQPFVMSPENYLRARTIYGDSVFWVEAPLSDADLAAVTLANKTPEQRKTYAKNPLKIDIEQLKAYERRALELGFPLKGDESVLFDGKVKATPEEISAIRALIATQKTKPLWTVLRAGSAEDRPNYFICGVLWCVRDELPLIPEEYESPTLRSGEDKPTGKGCPFCGGTLIKNVRSPGPGETVFERRSSGMGSGKVAQYIGFPNKLYHPDGFAVPCCFVDPDDLHMPDGAKPLPPPHPDIPLPDLQQSEETNTVSTAESAPSTVTVEEAPRLEADENRERPFAPLRLKGGAQSSWYIPTQNVVGRIATEFYSLGRGEVGVPPPSVNAILGQDPDTFLTANKGALGVSINSYLKSPGSAFVRYGIGSTGILGLIAFAEYASAALSADPSVLKIANPEAIYNRMFGDNKVATARAFEQANYGTLLHEFANEGREINETEFADWCREMGIPLRSFLGQRTYALSFYKAWLTFRDYMADSKQTKDLRLFEGLFADRRLLTPTGFVLVRIVVPKTPTEKATILCPEFGLSLLQQEVKPPLLFVIQDSVTGAYDPLVLYDSPNKDEKHCLGLIQPETPAFGALSAPLREAMSAFVSQYYGPYKGCGVLREPINPWLPDTVTSTVPRATPFLRKLDDMNLRLIALLRDRSNRLVGAIVRPKKPATHPVCFVPLLDDGGIFHFYVSYRGEEVLPKPPLSALLDMLMGERYPPAKGKVASADNFPGLLPVSIGQDGTNYISIDLACGAMIPIEPFSVKSTIVHSRFQKLLQDKKVTREYREEFPWDKDITLLGPTPAGAPDLDTTDEEQLEEAYQHLRISFAHWLHSTAKGFETLRQIELLRRARRRIPLWDLRKRMDVLVTNVLVNSENPWMTTEGSPVKTLLRKNCLQTKKAECTGGCTWAGDSARCLIHTPTTPRYVNPARVLSARLVDELIRTFSAAEEVLKEKVPFLRPLSADALVKGEDSLLFAAEGRGSTALYDKLGYSGRKPTAYTHGLAYPEEVDMEVDGDVQFTPSIPEDWSSKIGTVTFGADIDRDPRAKFEAALINLSGKTIEDLETEMAPIPLDNSPESIEKLATILHVNILTTAYNSETRRVELDLWYGDGAKDGNYVVYDLEGIPLARRKTAEFSIPRGRLPRSIRRWLEEHSPE
jgi:hypothetical protein